MTLQTNMCQNLTHSSLTLITMAMKTKINLSEIIYNLSHSPRLNIVTLSRYQVNLRVIFINQTIWANIFFLFMTSLSLSFSPSFSYYYNSFVPFWYYTEFTQKKIIKHFLLFRKSVHLKYSFLYYNPLQSFKSN